jgi:hypothetical protein
MWIYEQKTGWLSRQGKRLAQGYSGFGPGKNSPSMENAHNVGPIPQGSYEAGEPHTTDEHGPYVLKLTPDPKNIMFGRSGFLIHGDSIKSPGNASQGCIILPRFAREFIWQSGDRQIKVVDQIENEDK